MKYTRDNSYFSGFLQSLVHSPLVITHLPITHFLFKCQNWGYYSLLLRPVHGLSFVLFWGYAVCGCSWRSSFSYDFPAIIYTVLRKLPRFSLPLCESWVSSRLPVTRAQCPIVLHMDNSLPLPGIAFVSMATYSCHLSFLSFHFHLHMKMNTWTHVI